MIEKRHGAAIYLRPIVYADLFGQHVVAGTLRSRGRLPISLESSPVEE